LGFIGAGGHAQIVHQQEITMSIRYGVATAALVVGLFGVAQAQTLKPIQSQRIDLGQVAGDAYYTVEPNGYRVVATFAERGDAGAPIRFQALLGPGQTVTFSAPGGVGTAADAVEISRQNDRVLVRKAVVVD
jgi:hypothetical protein